MPDNYQICIIKMKRFEDFIHHNNTMQGFILRDSSVSNINYKYNVDYYIYSYSTLMCFVDFKNKKYCINPGRYSVTTSKQVSYIRRAAIVWERSGFERILWMGR